MPTQDDWEAGTGVRAVGIVRLGDTPINCRGGRVDDDEHAMDIDAELRIEQDIANERAGCAEDEASWQVDDEAGSQQKKSPVQPGGEVESSDSETESSDSEAASASDKDEDEDCDDDDDAEGETCRGLVVGDDDDDAEGGACRGHVVGDDEATPFSMSSGRGDGNDDGGGDDSEGSDGEGEGDDDGAGGGSGGGGGGGDDDLHGGCNDELALEAIRELALMGPLDNIEDAASITRAAAECAGRGCSDACFQDLVGAVMETVLCRSSLGGIDGLVELSERMEESRPSHGSPGENSPLGIDT
jgi:hypothetical protein